MGIEKKMPPSMDQWLAEAKKDPDAAQMGMYLVHNGTVRQTAKAKARNVDGSAPDVTGMYFEYDAARVEEAENKTRSMEGIYYVRTWLNSGYLEVGDDIMYVMIGGDIRPRVIDALTFLVGTIKNECVVEKEIV